MEGWIPDRYERQLTASVYTTVEEDAAGYWMFEIFVKQDEGPLCIADGEEFFTKEDAADAAMEAWHGMLQPPAPRLARAVAKVNS